MSRRRRQAFAASDAGGTGRDRWLLSYADFMTLLLALFVVLYASAQAREERQESLFEGLQAAFLFSSPANTPIEADAEAEGATPTADENLAPVPYLAELEAELQSVVDELPREPGEEPGVRVDQSERGLVLSLASAEFFPAGGVEIPADRREALASLAPFLAARAGSVLFEGHTDDVPLQAGVHPSNWELSSARAASVARFFIEVGAVDPARVATTGFAQYRPLEENDTPAGRARNRRVEIVILEEGLLVPAGDASQPRDELDELLEELPPIPTEVDESLRPPPVGPPPEDIPLP